MPSFPFFRERPQKHEWLGGHYTFPLEIHEGKKAFRPDCIIWLELPDRRLVGSTVIDPHQPATVTETLEEAMLRPAEGPPRRPARIRVPDEKMADELRRSIRGIPIIVAPVPELDEAFGEVSMTAERETTTYICVICGCVLCLAHRIRGA
jgi:hypothetical protein